MQSLTLIVLMFAAVWTFVYGGEPLLLPTRDDATFGNNFDLRDCHAACVRFYPELYSVTIEKGTKICNCKDAKERTRILLEPGQIPMKGKKFNYLPCTREKLEKKEPCASMN